MIKRQKIIQYITEKTVTLTGMLIEGIILFTVLTILFFIMLQEDGWYLNMNIHPLLLITVYFGFRHGIAASLIVSLVSSLHYYLCYLYLGLDPLMFFIDLDYSKFPLMFLASGYVSGRIHYVNTKRIRECREANMEIIKAYDDIRSSYDAAAGMIEELKNEIVGAEHSIFSLYEIAQSLQSFNPEKIYTESIGLLYKFVKAKGVSIYKLSDNGFLRLKIRYGSDNSSSTAKSSYENNTYKKVVKYKKAFRWQDMSGASSPVFSAPILYNQKVIGIIDIDSIGFEYVTEYSFSVFQVISDWISKALHQAFEIDNKLYPKDEKGASVLNLARYYEQLDEEKRRKQKYDLPFCEVIYSSSGHDPEKIAEIIRGTLRDVDYLHVSSEEQIIQLLLPATSEDDFKFAEQRIFSNLNMELHRLRR